jgi:hypothetical protein
VCDTQAYSSQDVHSSPTPKTQATHSERVGSHKKTVGTQWVCLLCSSNGGTVRPSVFQDHFTPEPRKHYTSSFGSRTSFLAGTDFISLPQDTTTKSSLLLAVLLPSFSLSNTHSPCFSINGTEKHPLYLIILSFSTIPSHGIFFTEMTINVLITKLPNVWDK